MTDFEKKVEEARVAVRHVLRNGGLKPAARKLQGTKWTYNKLHGAYRFAVEQGLVEALANKSRRAGAKGKTIAGSERRHYGHLQPRKVEKAPLPAKGKVRHYLFTCAQNNTKVFDAFWDNLVAFKEYLGAELHVSRITYKKNEYRAQYQKKETLYGGDDVWWAEPVRPFISDLRLEVAPGLVFCGDIDILPTAERPLQGMETYTGRRSGIFPHTKIALDSIPSNKFEATKFNYTTGTVTLRNYIQRKVGQKAEFHHCYGALLVEVDDAGNWYCRQINADSTGTFYDLDRRVKDGKVTDGHRVEAIYWGDVHVIEADRQMLDLAFAKGGMKDELRPKFDFAGDVISFKSRSHWDNKNPHRLFLRKQAGEHDVRKEVRQAGDVVNEMVRPWCETNLVYGNHERHIGRWLKEATWSVYDTTNAEFWSRLQAETFAYMRKNSEEPNYFALALAVAGHKTAPAVRFLMQDESVIVAPDANGGIECGAYHGDIGPGGAKGTPRGFAKAGRKMCIGDKHYANITDGVYTAGAFSHPDKIEWVHGPSNWSCSNIVIYPNGKRAIVTFWNRKWRA